MTDFTFDASLTRRESLAARLVNVLTRTDERSILTILRVALAVVIFPHGAQKLLGWFGGYGFAATMGFMTNDIGAPAILAFLVIIAESFGAVALLLGFGSRIVAPVLAATMVVATATVHLQHGFFMNWSGQQAGEGFEFHILAFAIAVALTIGGSGRFSIDGIIGRSVDARR
ncbi:MAG TPA: DoxX family protein [Thermoanaerobaculia bacterium]|nr:DoxX family protein [Thermoanaerobaculia bacterium]